jgi:hypothetical protein
VLISGPVDLDTRRKSAESMWSAARDMLAALKYGGGSGAIALYMAAAVADWRPARRMRGNGGRRTVGQRFARIDRRARTPTSCAR